jgi:glycosyltransferase involved in cell wall biosynthesis
MIIDINEFPKNKLNKIEWPWSHHENNFQFSEFVKYPKISIVTPSFNQGSFIEETIRSILLQNYPNLEYIIIDGGSKDNTLDIISHYKKWIDIIISEKDSGQSNAINKGWKLATGEITTWINSDDFLAPNCLYEVAQQYLNGKGVNNIIVGRVINFYNNSEKKFEITQKNIDFDNVIRFWNKSCIWHQPGFFFPMGLIVKNNYLDEVYHYSMDFDLLCKILQNTNVIYSEKIFTYFRLHEISKGVSSPQNTINEKVLIASKYWKRNSRHMINDIYQFMIWFFKYFIKSLFNLSFNFKFKNYILFFSKWV